MANARRVARELALKTLYQMDVARTPLRDALDAALEQVRVTVTSPARQVVTELQRELDAAQAALIPAADSIERRAMTVLSRRTLAEVSAVADRVAEVVHEILSPHPSDPDGLRESLHNTMSAARTEVARLSADSRAESGFRNETGCKAQAALDRMERLLPRLLDAAAPLSDFTARLTEQTWERRSELDARLLPLLSGWPPERQPAVDRSILRMAAYEILHEPEIPAAVSINEAVELAKKYSTDDSGRFVNGVLGTLAREAGLTLEAAAALPDEDLHLELAGDPGDETGDETRDETGDDTGLETELETRDASADSQGEHEAESE